MAKNQMTKILENPEVHEAMTHGYNGILASLFIRILRELNVSVARWSALMADFVNDASNGVPDNQKDRTSMRGNLTKEFSRKQMTWKVFVKGLRFLQIKKFQVTITAQHQNGRVTVHHSKMINLGDRSQLRALLQDVDSSDEADQADEDTTGAQPSANQDLNPASAAAQRAQATEAARDGLINKDPK